MNGTGHTYLAATTAVTYVAATSDQLVLDAPQNAAILAAALVGAGIPDTDLKLPFVTHRGLTHRAYLHAALIIVTYVVAGTVAPAFAAPVAVGLAIGLVTHAVGDMVTPAGLAYLSPLVRRDLRILPFRLRVVPGRPWAFPRAVRTDRAGRPMPRPYVAVAQEYALAAATLIDGAILYLTLPL